MGLVTPPDAAEYEANDNADGTRVSNDITALVSEFNGNIDSANLADDSVTTDKIVGAAVNVGKIASSAVRNANIDYSEAGGGVKAWQFGPNFPGAFGGIIARVQKTSVTLDGVGTADSVTFTFATDCADGDPGFSATPTVLGFPIVTASDSPGVNDAITGARVTAISSTAVTIELQHGGSSADVTLEFGVAGPV